PCQFDHGFVGQADGILAFRLDFAEPDLAGFGIEAVLVRLGVRRALEDLQGDLVDLELSGRDVALDHPFAQPPARFDDDLGPVAGDGVERKHDAGGTRLHHLLYAHAYGEVGQGGDLLVFVAIGKNGVAKHARPAFARITHDLLYVGDPQKGFVLARKAGPREVFGFAAGTYGDGYVDDAGALFQ